LKGGNNNDFWHRHKFSGEADRKGHQKDKRDLAHDKFEVVDGGKAKSKSKSANSDETESTSNKD